MGSELNDHEEDFRAVFGENEDISHTCRDQINKIRNNDPRLTRLFSLYHDDAEYFSDLAWQLLGGYIAGNDRLEEVDMAALKLRDAKICLLFKHLSHSSFIKKFDVSENDFGLMGIQKMVPFLKNTPSLTDVDVGENETMNTECFRSLLRALDGGSIEKLHMRRCNIEEITELEHCSLSHLKSLDFNSNNIQTIPSLEKYTSLETLRLHGNSIGKEGCGSIAKLLQNPSSRLRNLNLASNDICDEGAEILAQSLERNTGLSNLCLGGNEFQQRGFRAFLKLLNDVFSIERTYNSNNTLAELELPPFIDSKCCQIKKHIFNARKIYQDNGGDCHAIGRAKVIETQLKSVARMQLCLLQGISYTHGSLFEEIETVLIPNILALTGNNHGQNELYRVLAATAPDLTSLIDKTSVLKRTAATNALQIASFTAEHKRQTADFLNQVSTLSGEHCNKKKKLNSVGSGGEDQPVVTDKATTTQSICGRKRRRSATVFEWFG